VSAPLKSRVLTARTGASAKRRAMPKTKPMSEAARKLGLPRIEKGERLTGDKAAAFTEQVVDAYRTNLAPIQLICEATGRSYGSIHTLLTKAKVTMRPRGGQRRAAAPDAPSSEVSSRDNAQ
jgi:hypothetical protein